MTDAAAGDLLAIAGGYPYAIQVAGHFAWRASHHASEITAAHASKAHARIEADLEQLFQARWDDASPKEQVYLNAVAWVTTQTDQLAHGGTVAAYLDKKVTALSYLRDRLLKKGTLYQDPDGGLRFITPGMATWVLTHRGTEKPVEKPAGND